MGSARTRPKRRRGMLLTGLAVGAVGGAVAGAALLSSAGPDPTRAGPLPTVLHAAPALVDANRPVRLVAASVCADPGTASCEVSGAAINVRPAIATGWSRLDGRLVQGAFHFDIPAELVPQEGFWYWLDLSTAAGERVAYPPGGSDSAFRVVTTAGLPARTLGAFDWDHRRRPDGTSLRLPYGGAAGEVGRTDGGPNQLPAGPSSFDVAPDGSIYVADWVNRRIEVFDPAGRLRRAIGMPVSVPADLAVADGGRVFVSTLGSDATTVELAPDGRVLGRYPVAYGVVARIAATETGPRVLAAPAQWSAVRDMGGSPLGAEAQAATQTSSVPLDGGDIGVSQDLPGDRVAFAWTRSDGSRAGAVVSLPDGVFAGSDYFVRPLGDGGAVAARGVWDGTHSGVGLFRFDAAGRIVAFDLLPEPSTEQDARFSTVRFGPPRDVLVAYAGDRAVRIDRFEVSR
jgi:hypothetical protein